MAVALALNIIMISTSDLPETSSQKPLRLLPGMPRCTRLDNLSCAVAAVRLPLPPRRPGRSLQVKCTARANARRPAGRGRSLSLVKYCSDSDWNHRSGSHNFTDTPTRSLLFHRVCLGSYQVARSGNDRHGVTVTPHTSTNGRSNPQLWRQKSQDSHQYSMYVVCMYVCMYVCILLPCYSFCSRKDCKQPLEFLRATRAPPRFQQE